MHDIPLLLLVVVSLALLFDYVNGMHDSANAIATVVSTRALTPRQAVILAGALNFIGAFLFEGVAKTMGKGLIAHTMVKQQEVIVAAVVGALLWNLITWYLGLPSSSSHALVGGLVGAGLYASGWKGVIWKGVIDKVVIPGLVSPLLGLIIGFIVMLCLLWLLHKVNPSRVNKVFLRLQVLSASLMALSHGTNDAQKAMGIITLALVTGGFQSDFSIPLWVKIACASMIALGTAAGGWRIIKTLGVKVVKLQPIHGFAAETTASLVLMSTAHLGMPVSTTHVISSSIMGVGATKRLSAVRWGVAGNILAAWLLTLPAAAFMAWLTLGLFRLIF